MATRYAVATGNWSALATWDGGVALPAAGDDVHANGFTVTIDQDINVGSLRTTAGGAPPAAGGGFVISANGGIDVVLTDATNGIRPGTTTVLTHSATSGTNTVTATLTHGGTTNSVHCIAVTGVGGRLDFTGNISYNALAGTQAAAIHVSVAATLNVVGNLLGNANGSSTNNSACIETTGAATINVTGNVTGGTNSNHYGIRVSSNSPTITVTGDVTGGASGTSNHGIFWAGTGSLTLNGDVYATANRGIDITGAGTITINGDVTASTAAGILSTASSTVIITGTITASSGANAVESSGASSVVRVSGDMVDHATTGQRAIYARRMEGNWSAPHSWKMRNTGGGDVYLVTEDSLAGLPDEEDVREATSYGGGLLTGTLAVPDPATVLSGVDTDDTVGTYTATPAAITAAVWAALPSSFADGDTMGFALRAVAAIARNKVVTDPVAGTYTVYDDAGVALLVGDLWQDAAGTVPYAGAGAERRDRLT